MRLFCLQIIWEALFNVQNPSSTLFVGKYDRFSQYNYFKATAH